VKRFPLGRRSVIGTLVIGVVLALSLSTTAVSSGAADTSGNPHISGTVTDFNGNPVADVAVGAYQASDSWLPTLQATTDASGNYVLDGAQLDVAYRIRFGPPSESNLVPEWYGGPKRSSSLDVRLSETHPTADVDAQLALGGSLTGSVVASSNGSVSALAVGPPGGPIANTLVWAYRSDDRLAGTYLVRTGVDGTYRINGIDPTTQVRLRFDPPAGSGLASVWFGDVPLRSSAFPLVVRAGQTVNLRPTQLGAPGDTLTPLGPTHGLAGFAFSVQGECPNPTGAGGSQVSVDDNTLLFGGTLQWHNTSSATFMSKSFVDASTDAAIGQHFARVSCQARNADGSIFITKTFAPIIFRVTGPAPLIHLTPSEAPPGGSIQINAGQCPNVPGVKWRRVRYFGFHGNFPVGSGSGGFLQDDPKFPRTTVSADGHWTAIHLRVPTDGTAVPGMTGEAQVTCFDADQPPGDYDPYADIRETYSQTFLNAGYSISQPAFKYVALGDSFSAGEGIEPFFDATNGCHRSQLAYATRIHEPGRADSSLFDRWNGGDASVQWGFQACSGATTASMLSEGHAGDPLPQLALNRAGDVNNPLDLPVDANTSLVTLTIGGNNVHFSDILQFCFFSSDCTKDKYQGQSLQSWIDSAINALSPQLDAVYTRIHSQAPKARVLVLGYPQLFPQTLAEQRCFKLAHTEGTRGFTTAEQNLLRNADSKLNQLIQNRAAANGHVEFVRVDSLFASHEVCGSGGEWINGPTYSIGTGKANDQSFHPNSCGQDAMAVLVDLRLGLGLRAAVCP
jgi:hypothetical protein